MNPDNQFVEYAIKYNVSLVEAFKDRDEPMNKASLSREWKDATEKEITEEELKQIM